MCTNRKWITNAHGMKLVVNCGHCPACLQEKAIKRANRIRNNASSEYMTLFVTLTYRNAAVPYFDADEFNCAPIKRVCINDAEDGKPEFQLVKYMPIYRNIVARRDFKNKCKFQKTLLGVVEVPYPVGIQDSSLKSLNGFISKTKKVGVCYYPDLQNFFKRLRQNLKRKYHVSDHFQYYACSEYGAGSQRCHFHILLYVKRSPSCFKMWQSAISEAWPFDGYGITKRNIEIAINAASYVSTYINCTTYLPKVLNFGPIKPKHSYSQGFGCALQRLSLPQVCESFRRGDLFCDVARLRDGALIVERVLLPKYVVSRYFPKFKGYSLLSSREIECLSSRPETIAIYRTKCCYSDEDCHRIEVMLRHKQDLFAQHGIDKFEFARIYSQIWSLYSSSVYRQSLEDLPDAKLNFIKYDNIKEFFEGRSSSPSLQILASNYPVLDVYDINEFPDIVQQTETLNKWFELYDKSRKINNKVYSHYNNHF